MLTIIPKLIYDNTVILPYLYMYSWLFPNFRDQGRPFCQNCLQESSPFCWKPVSTCLIEYIYRVLGINYIIISEILVQLPTTSDQKDFLLLQLPNFPDVYQLFTGLEIASDTIPWMWLLCLATKPFSFWVSIHRVLTRNLTTFNPLEPNAQPRFYRFSSVNGHKHLSDWMMLVLYFSFCGSQQFCQFVNLCFTLLSVPSSPPSPMSLEFVAYTVY